LNPLIAGAGDSGQTLGRLVINARINGGVKRATGHIGSQNWAVAQINILVGE
jgi:hypothetical protein